MSLSVEPQSGAPLEDCTQADPLQPDGVSPGTAFLRWAARTSWWSVGIGPCVTLFAMLCGMAILTPVYEGDGARQFALLAILVLLLLGACIWQWFRPARPGLRELPRCFLLALPMTYGPTLAIDLFLSGRLPTDSLLVPEWFATWGTVYGVAIGVVFLIRQLDLKEPAHSLPASSTCDRS